MTGDTATLILELMQTFEGTQDETRPHTRYVREDIGELGRRVTTVEARPVRFSRRLDRVDEPIERGEGRLDPVEG